MGRALAGFIGDGHVELTDGGLVVHARRHRYKANLVGGAIVGALGLVVGVLIARAEGEQFNIMFAVFGAILGAFLTSLGFRFAPRVTAVVPWSSITHLGPFGSALRVFCRTGGDVQLTARPEHVHALVQACQARHIPV